MKLSDIDSLSQVSYRESCTCGKRHVVLTQRDNFPEYETEIYILCDCGEYVEFILPVN